MGVIACVRVRCLLQGAREKGPACYVPWYILWEQKRDGTHSHEHIHTYTHLPTHPPTHPNTDTHTKEKISRPYMSHASSSAKKKNCVQNKTVTEPTANTFLAVHVTGPHPDNVGRHGSTHATVHVRRKTRQRGNNRSKKTKSCPPLTGKTDARATTTLQFGIAWPRTRTRQRPTQSPDRLYSNNPTRNVCRVYY